MSLLTDGKLAGVVGKVLGSTRIFGEDVTLSRRDAGIDADGVPVATFTTHAMRGTPLEISAFRRSAEQIPDGDTEVIIYQLRAPVMPRLADLLDVRGKAFEIQRVTADPANATWLCRVRVLS